MSPIFNAASAAFFFAWKNGKAVPGGADEPIRDMRRGSAAATAAA
jgi:hypothetical protein